MRLKGLLLVVFVWAGLGLFYPPAFGQGKENAPAPTDSEVLKLYEAVMCEDIYANAPRNPAVVFSASQEKAVCFTAFDPVPQPTFIYHNWFYRDIPSAKIRLGVQPPRWSTYSSIQIRKTDIGPWRVEITDEKGTVLRTLRFSITE